MVSLNASESRRMCASVAFNVCVPNMAALPGGGHDRCEEATGKAQHGQRQRSLHDGHHRPGGRQGEQQGKGQAGWYHTIEPEGCEDGEIEHTDARSLQALTVPAAAFAQAPADDGQPQPAQGDCSQAQFDGQQGMLGRLAQQEGHAEEQDQHAHAHDGVAAAQPGQGGLAERGGDGHTAFIGRGGQGPCGRCSRRRCRR